MSGDIRIRFPSIWESPIYRRYVALRDGKADLSRVGGPGWCWNREHFRAMPEKVPSRIVRPAGPRIIRVGR
jgi:hypothetical protein